MCVHYLRWEATVAGEAEPLGTGEWLELLGPIRLCGGRGDWRRTGERVSSCNDCPEERTACIFTDAECALAVAEARLAL